MKPGRKATRAFGSLRAPDETRDRTGSERVKRLFVFSQSCRVFVHTHIAAQMETIKWTTEQRHGSSYTYSKKRNFVKVLAEP